MNDANQNLEAKNESQTSQAKTEKGKGLGAIIKDTTLIITGLTALLYFWGSAIDNSYYTLAGVPLSLIPEASVQYYLFQGGVVGILTLIALITIFIAFWEKIRLLFAAISLPEKIVGIGITVLIFLILPVWIHFQLNEIFGWVGTKSSQVKNIRFATERRDLPSYEGFYFLGKKDTNYIFGDKLGNEATIYVVHEDEVKELVLTRSWAKPLPSATPPSAPPPTK